MKLLGSRLCSFTLHSAFFLGASFALVMFSAEATSFFIRPFSEFTLTADNIVRGRITNVRVENGITSDGGTTIYTYATLEVKDRIKGEISSPNITIRKTGGTKDGMTLEIPSSPEFEEGEDGVIFLSAQREDKSYETVGLELGKFGIEKKDGKDILTGGIFAYSKPEAPGEPEHNVQAGDLRENLRPWSVQDLKELVAKQGNVTVPTQNNLQPNVTITNLSQISQTNSTPSPNQDTQVQAKDYSDTLPQKPDMTLLYGAIGLFVAVGIFLYLKRRG